MREGKGKGGWERGEGGEREKEGKGRGGACPTNQKIVPALLHRRRRHYHHILFYFSIFPSEMNLIRMQKAL